MAYSTNDLADTIRGEYKRLAEILKENASVFSYSINDTPKFRQLLSESSLSTIRMNYEETKYVDLFSKLHCYEGAQSNIKTLVRILKQSDQIHVINDINTLCTKFNLVNLKNDLNRTSVMASSSRESVYLVKSLLDATKEMKLVEIKPPADQPMVTSQKLYSETIDVYQGHKETTEILPKQLIMLYVEKTGQMTKEHLKKEFKEKFNLSEEQITELSNTFEMQSSSIEHFLKTYISEEDMFLLLDLSGIEDSEVVTKALEQIFGHLCSKINLKINVQTRRICGSIAEYNADNFTKHEIELLKCFLHLMYVPHITYSFMLTHKIKTYTNILICNQLGLSPKEFVEGDECITSAIPDFETKASIVLNSCRKPRITKRERGANELTFEKLFG